MAKRVSRAMSETLGLVDRLDAAVAYVVCAKRAAEAVVGDGRDRDAISTVLDDAIEQLRSVSDDLSSRRERPHAVICASDHRGSANAAARTLCANQDRTPADILSKVEAMVDALTETSLAQFTGSARWYRHALNRSVLFTDGAKHVADAGGAYWLLDEIAMTQLVEPNLAGEEFQVWTLTRKASAGATLVCDDGNGNPLFAKDIEFTDFPLDTIALWFCIDTIMLPSEY